MKRNEAKSNESFSVGWWRFCGFNAVTFKNNNSSKVKLRWRREKTKVIGFIHAVSSSILSWIGCLPACERNAINSSSNSSRETNKPPWLSHNCSQNILLLLLWIDGGFSFSWLWNHCAPNLNTLPPPSPPLDCCRRRRTFAYLCFFFMYRK